MCINNYEKPIGHAFSGTLKLPGSPVMRGIFIYGNACYYCLSSIYAGISKASDSCASVLSVTFTSPFSILLISALSILQSAYKSRWLKPFSFLKWRKLAPNVFNI